MRVCTQSLQPCPTLCDPMDGSPPGSSVHETLQGRILEQVATPFSRGCSNPGIKSRSPASQADSLPLSRRGSPQSYDHMELNDVNKNSLGSESVLRPSKQELGLPTISSNNFCSPELGALHGDCVAPLGFWQFVPLQEKTHLPLCESEC